jgi:hypothetical protein
MDKATPQEEEACYVALKAKAPSAIAVIRINLQQGWSPENIATRFEENMKGSCFHVVYYASRYLLRSENTSAALN